MKDIFSSIQENALDINNFVSTAVNGNEFASALILTTMLGMAAYTLKRIPFLITKFLKRHLTTKVTLTDNLVSYHMLISSFEKKGLFSNLRTAKVTNGEWDRKKKTVKGLGYGNHFMMYGRYPIMVNLSRIGELQQDVSEMTITTLGRSHKVINTIIEDIKDSVDNSRNTGYFLFAKDDDSFQMWQPKRTFDSIYIDASEKKRIMDVLDNFMDSRDFYTANGIPYHLGILLHGEPGTGKTSLIKAIAAYLDKNIVITKSSDTFAGACASNNSNVVVAEEVDTFGTSKRNLNDGEESGSHGDTGNFYTDGLGEFALGLLLNGMDGLLSSHGRVFIMTTNKRSELDEALLRPGRIDLEVYVSYMTNESFKMMIDNFYGADIEMNFEIRAGVTPSNVQQDILEKMSLENIINKYAEVNNVSAHSK